MFDLKTDTTAVFNEISDIIKLFYPPYCKETVSVKHTCSEEKLLLVSVTIEDKIYNFTYDISDASDKLDYVRKFVRANKLAVYKALEGHTGRTLPWGSLTGIRPTKLGYELLSEGFGIGEISALMQKNFFLSREKADLLQRIIVNQQGFYEDGRDYVNLYVHIPFCVSRCDYCSFITNLTDQKRKLIDPYVVLLCEEIEDALQLIKANHLKIYSIYIGGGTPTALSPSQLEKVLKAVGQHSVEYTCEAGRPDTITKEKLEIMRDCGVNRISVNPQSLNDSTLARIGRSHSVKDFFEAYGLALKHGFMINTDVIAGLNGESLGEFKRTVDGLLNLKPDNITVHTLARKNGSELKLNNCEINGDTLDMVKYASDQITSSGYEPYYLYRQKEMLFNLENTGYCLKGRQCRNNVTTMEETLGVVACGAGAISKRVYRDEKRIERLANLRSLELYIAQFSERLHKKRLFFSN